MNNSMLKKLNILIIPVVVICAVFQLNLYGAFPDVPYCRNQSGNVKIMDNPFRYCGYYSDNESGLFYCGSRYYFPETGSWLSRDSKDVVNRYNYCNSDPVRYSDQNGHAPNMTRLCTYVISGVFASAIIAGGISLIAFSSDFDEKYSQDANLAGIAVTCVGGLVSILIGGIIMYNRFHRNISQQPPHRSVTLHPLSKASELYSIPVGITTQIHNSAEGRRAATNRQPNSPRVIELREMGQHSH